MAGVPLVNVNNKGTTGSGIGMGAGLGRTDQDGRTGDILLMAMGVP